MNPYRRFRKNYPIFSFVTMFLTVAVVMFGFFFLQVMRPMSKIKERMNNENTPWTHIRENIVKVNYGDSPARVVELLGKPDEIYESVNVTLYSYQKYGLYLPSFKYEVQFKADTLHKIAAESR